MTQITDFKEKWKACEEIYYKMDESTKQHTLDYLEQVMKMFTSQIHNMTPETNSQNIDHETETETSVEANLPDQMLSQSTTNQKLTSIVHQDFVKIVSSKGTHMETLPSTETQPTDVEWLKSGGKTHSSEVTNETSPTSVVNSSYGEVNSSLQGNQTDIGAIKVDSQLTLNNPVITNSSISEVKSFLQTQTQAQTSHGEQETMVNDWSEFRNKSGSGESQNNEKSKWKLSSPERTHARSVTCEECGRTLSSASNLIVHMRSHTGIKPFKCEMCQKSFSTRANKRRHERSHQSNKQYQCDSCPQRFTEKRTLIAHARIHTGDKPYKCTKCGEAFTQQSALASHHTTQLGIKSYMCEECGATFKRKSQLSMHHRRIHTAVKDHACSVCGKSFVNKSDLKRHTKVHDTEGRLCCPHCRLQFANVPALQYHLKTCRSKPRYLCTKCNKIFPNTAKLKVHLRTKEHFEKQNLTQDSAKVALVPSDQTLSTNLATEVVDSEDIHMEDGGASENKGISDEILHQLLAGEEIVQTDLGVKMTEGDQVNVQMLNKGDGSVVLIPVMVKEHGSEVEEN